MGYYPSFIVHPSLVGRPHAFQICTWKSPCPESLEPPVPHEFTAASSVWLAGRSDTSVVPDDSDPSLFTCCPLTGTWVLDPVGLAVGVAAVVVGAAVGAGGAAVVEVVVVVGAGVVVE